jgi:hypothetical protein
MFINLIEGKTNEVEGKKIENAFDLIYLNRILSI